MTSDEQLKEWVKGNSIHNPDRDECCPDFRVVIMNFWHPKMNEKSLPKAMISYDYIWV